jgi:hypothetical protein
MRFPLVDKTLSECRESIPLINGNLYYRYYWKKQNKNIDINK